VRKLESFYLPQLDGLRFFAFLSVFFWHFMADWCVAFLDSPHSVLAKMIAQSLTIGQNGVDLFFALSAYLITELLIRERRTYSAIDARSFYVRRALRIWPLYFSTLLLTSIAAILIPALTGVRAYLPWYFLFVGNFALCRWDCGPGMWLSPLWSVSVEEQFYFLWPLTMRHLSRRQIIQAAIALWAVAIAFRFHTQGAPPYAISFNTLSRLDPIAAGILIAAVLNGRTEIFSRIKPTTVVLIGAILWVLGFIVTLSAVWPIPRLDHFQPIAESLVALGSAAFLIAALCGRRHRVLAARPLVYLGRISYGLYVFHAAVIMAGAALFYSPHAMARWALMITELAATIVLAAASYRWFEVPFLRLKVRFQRVTSGAITENTREVRSKRFGALPEIDRNQIVQTTTPLGGV
jgi:peptidoglycan/LPS O-acetylase OafA/YrhL